MSIDVLAGLDPEQRLVAEALRGPVIVHAGAGTGKTRAITHRIAHAVHSGQHAIGSGLAVTFTNRAAGEMRGRLAQLGVPGLAVRTFHAAALSQLRYFWPEIVGGPFPALVASKIAMVGQACRAAGISTNRSLVRDLASEIEWAGSSMVGAGEYVAVASAAGRTPIGSGDQLVDLPGIARAIEAYQGVKESSNSIDFEDVLLSMVAMLADRPDVADVVRKRYRWFTVDEYQDITPAQQALLDGWLGERDDVCVVGDPSQTIYSFAGADAGSMRSFGRRWPAATEIRLDRCYRSTPQIVAVANSIVRAGAAEARASPPVMLRSQRDDGSAPELVTCADDADEAANIASRIADMAASGINYREIAILVRTNGATEPLEAALAQRNISYVMRGGERFFERPEVREAFVRLRGQLAAERVGDGVPEGHAASVDSSVNETQVVAETIAVLAGMGWDAAGPATGGASRERWESLAAVVGLAREVAAAGGARLADLVAEFEQRAEHSHVPAADGVTIATLHAAKGLEWTVVFVAGCSEGSLPIVYADTEARVAEERRLFYVGITRARDRLVLTRAMTRAGSGKHREPSRFLAELRVSGKVSVGVSSAGVVREGRSLGNRERRRRPPSRCRVCGKGLVTGAERTLGRCAACPGSADEQLLERLRAWRLTTAKVKAVPAYVVFTDVTLNALAERRPTTNEELLDIPGIGPTKIQTYGEEILAMVRA